MSIDGNSADRTQPAAAIDRDKPQLRRSSDSYPSKNATVVANESPPLRGIGSDKDLRATDQRIVVRYRRRKERAPEAFADSDARLRHLRARSPMPLDGGRSDSDDSEDARFFLLLQQLASPSSSSSAAAAATETGERRTKKHRAPAAAAPAVDYRRASIDIAGTTLPAKSPGRVRDARDKQQTTGGLRDSPPKVVAPRSPSPAAIAQGRRASMPAPASPSALRRYGKRLSRTMATPLVLCDGAIAAPTASATLQEEQAAWQDVGDDDTAMHNSKPSRHSRKPRASVDVS
jgi:hypothetical protein